MDQDFGYVNPPSERSCVYTCLVGRYEKLNEQPMARQSAVPFICLTDDPDLTSETWRIVQINPLIAQDPVRSQRMLKLLPYRYFADVDRSLYIDNAVVLTVPPERLFAEYRSDAGLALPAHSDRKTVREEFAEVSKFRFDDPERIAEQLAIYESSDPAALDEHPYWAAMLMRDHNNTKVREVFEIWAMHVLRFSRRDQLSANYAFRFTGFAPRRIKIDNHVSWFHRWPIIEDRRQDIQVFHSKSTEAEKEITRLAQELNVLTQEGNATRNRATAAEQAAALLRTEITRLSQSLLEQTEQVQRLMTSRSWRITAPLRKIGRWLQSGNSRLG